MRPGTGYQYVQIGFVIIYLIAGFALLLVPGFQEKMTDSARYAFAIILLVYAGYRGITVYNNFRRNDD